MFRFDPNARGFNENPFPIWAYLRENDPVHWWDDGHAWIVTRYEDVHTTLTDPRFSVEFRFYGPADLLDEHLNAHQLLTKHGIFWLPPEDHDRVRRIVAPLFTTKAVVPLRKMVRELVGSILGPFEGRSSCDFVRDIVLGYPAQAITSILGIPGDRRAQFLEFASAVLDAFYPALGADAYDEKMSLLPQGLELVRSLVETGRNTAGPGLLNAMAAARVDDQQLSPAELLSMVAVAISAGSEPTRHLVVGTILNLLSHPDQLELLRKDPDLLGNAVGEVGRFDSMGKLNFPRFPLEDVTLRGIPIKAGTPVFGVFASALRDPTVFPDPDRFDIRRDLRRTMLWGRGIHTCLGKAIAQVVVEEMVRGFLDRFPRVELAGDPVYTPDAFFRKIVSLELSLSG
jgi:cytochrome P450 enzyme